MKTQINSNYLKLVEEDPENIKMIPEDKRTKEICRMALENTFYKNRDDTSIIPYITHPELFLEVLKAIKDPEIMEFVVITLTNDRVFDRENISYIIDRNPRMLVFIPGKLISPELYEKAVEKLPVMLSAVPELYITPEMCLTAVKSDPALKRYVPLSISGKDNIYTFCLAFESEHGVKLSLPEANDLYAG